MTPASAEVVGIDALVDRYEALLLDAYGTLVDTTGALPGAVALVARLEATGKPYLILTNDAAKLPETAAARYRDYGLRLPAARILGSGLLLDAHFSAHGLVGARCAVLGPRDAERHVQRAGGDPVPITAAFDVLIVADQSGFDFLAGMDAALSSLCAAIDTGRPPHVVVPNPDLLYPASPGRFGFAAGTMARMLEAALAARYPHRTVPTFVRLGKPHAAMFDAAVARLGTRNALMIGDQLDTDIRGAADYGLDTALVCGGVSDAGGRSANETASCAPNRPGAVRPTYLLRSLL